MFVERIICRAIAILGVTMSVFMLATPHRIAAICVFGIILVAISKNMSYGRWDATGKFLTNYHRELIALVLLTGITLRIAIGLQYGYWKNPEQESDYLILYEQAKKVATGVFPISKSWVTITLYGVCYRIFPSVLSLVIFSHILNFASAFVLYGLSRRLFGKNCALVAFAMFCLSPELAFHGFRVATEHAYILFLSLALLFGARTIAAREKLSVIVNVSVAGLSAVLAMWSRGEGLLVVCALPIVFALTFLKDIKTLIWVELVFCCVCGCLGVVAMRINEAQGQQATIFCSNDNHWPRLFGATVSTHGHFDKDERNNVLAKAGFDVSVLRDNPFASPPEVITVVKQETRKRWHEMTFAVMVRHIVGKLRDAFCSSMIGLDANAPFKSFILMSVLSALPAVASFAALIYFAFAWGIRDSANRYAPIVALIMAGNMVIISIAETSPRYGILLYALWPHYAGVGLKAFWGCLKTRPIAND